MLTSIIHLEILLDDVGIRDAIVGWFFARVLYRIRCFFPRFCLFFLLSLCNRRNTFQMILSTFIFLL